MTPEHKALVALLESVRQELEEYEEAATGESYNNPKLNAAIESLSAQCAQPQASGPVAWRYKLYVADVDWTVSTTKPKGAIVEPLYASPQPANPAQVTDDLTHLTKLLHEARRIYAAAESADVGVEIGHYRRLREGHGCIGRLTAAIGAEPTPDLLPVKITDQNGAIRDAYVDRTAGKVVEIAAIGAGGQAVAPTVNELFANCDRWGAIEWFNRLAMAIHNRDKAVVAGDDLSFATYDNIAKSSAARLVHDFEQEVRSALSQPHPADEQVVEALRECATEGCEKPASVYFERGGIGSHYCHDCYMRVQALAQEGRNG